ncbi:MAG: NADH-quinone oxidoreductase subunit M, partial [Gammaproteobacteria bacterium]|nr:NADH-quinone oxidoreductase subunit M [Gammaproteobacteria bacterium]
MFSDLPLLSLIIWLPIFGGLLVLVNGDDRGLFKSRSLSLVIALATFILSIPLYTQFDSGTHLMQFQELSPWISTFNINYHLGVDGISVPLILLTTFTTVLVVIAGWEVIKFKPSQYMAAFLIMEGLMNGVFASLDSILFYVFWEA